MSEQRWTLVRIAPNLPWVLLDDPEPDLAKKGYEVVPVVSATEFEASQALAHKLDVENQEFAHQIGALESELSLSRGCNQRLRSDLDAVIDAGVGRWHSGEGSGLSLHVYLGLAWDRYAAWVERSPVQSGRGC